MRSRRPAGLFWIAAVIGVAVGLPALVSGLDGPPEVARVSVAASGDEGDGPTSAVSVSGDGRYVAFASEAPDLVSGDGNGARDVFVHDRVTGAMERVSVSSAGAGGDSTSGGLTSDAGPRISQDGRYVVFSSQASNLAPNDTPGTEDVFIHDRMLGTTERVSLNVMGSTPNGPSIAPSVSSDGRYVTFSSNADDLIEDDGNDTWDVFLRDRMAGTTELISVSSDEVQGDGSSGYVGAGAGRITPDGRYVVFGSIAENLVENDLNEKDDIFVRDRQLGLTERDSVSTSGVEGDGHSTHGDISADGQTVVFFSGATELAPNEGSKTIPPEQPDVFLHDRGTGITTRISDGLGGEPGDGTSRFPAVSADGALVAFQSVSSNLVEYDGNGLPDVFRYERANGSIERVSVGPGGVDAQGSSQFPAINGDGNVITFVSDAADLVESDGNNAQDGFAWGKDIFVPPTATPTSPGTATPTATRTPTATPPCDDEADVNNDGQTNSVDALFVLQFVAGLLDSLPDMGAADADGNGDITSVDAALILQHTAGLLPCLPT
jgi:Tol biopolymer transport system component